MITIIDNEEMCIKISESFKYNTETPDKRPLSDYILDKTIEKFELYRRIFNVEKLEKITFIIYDNIEEYRNLYRKINNQEPPEYARGSFDPELNISYCTRNNNPIYGSSMWYHTLGINAHEAFHMYYRKYIYKNDRIVWFDEGLAQFLSGENDNWLFDEEKFKDVFIKYNELYTPINNLNERIQGNDNVPDDLIFQRQNVFEGYKISLLIIKYLIDKNGINYIFDILNDNEEIRRIGNNIIDEMIDYYKNKYNIINNMKK